MLAFFVNILVISNYTPEASSDQPVIGLYYIFNIVLVSVSVSASVLVLNCHFRGHRVTRVPKWIKYVLLLQNNKAVNLLNNGAIYMKDCNSIHHYSPEKHNHISNHVKPRHDQFATDLEVLSNSIQSFEHTNHVKSRENRLKDFKVNVNHIKSTSHFKKSFKLLNNNNNSNANNISNNEKKHITEMNSAQITGKRLFHTNRTQSSDSLKHSQNSENLDKLLKIIRHSVKLIDKNYSRLKTSQIANDEWKLVASRLDFFLFIIATLVVFITPFLLFGKFMFKGDESAALNANNLKCKV